MRAKTSLQVFARHRMPVGQHLTEHRLNADVHVVNFVKVVGDTKGLRSVQGIVNGVLGRMATRHRQPQTFSGPNAAAATQAATAESMPPDRPSTIEEMEDLRQ